MPLPSSETTSPGNALTSAATWCAIALGFSLPISTAASNLLLAAVVVLFALSGNHKEKFHTIAGNPVAMAFAAFCALTLLGCLYGRGSSADKLHYLGKYLTLLAVPLLVPLFTERASRVRALLAFCAAMLLTLGLSFLIRFGWLPAVLLPVMAAPNPLVHVPDAVAFKLSITHGFLMAFTAFLFAVGASQAESLRLRRTLTVLAALAAFNVLFMVIGRTGYVVLAALGVYFLFCRFGRRGILLAAIAVLLVAAAAYQWSASFRERAGEVIAEGSAWKQGRGDPTSIGTRFDYYSNTLSIIRDQPLFGVGLGGFELAYGDRIKGTGMAPSNNPHNQYLLIAAQLGLVGLVGLLWLYARVWRGAGRLDPPFREIARGLLLAIVIGNLFNSFMLDFTERTLFAWLSGVLFAGLSTRNVQCA